MENNFYCQKKCGGSDYKHAHMNEALSDCEGMEFTDKERQQVIKGVHQSYQQLCIKQCKHCADIVTETQLKNKAIREKSQLSQTNNK